VRSRKKTGPANGDGRITLHDGARVAVVGGGPAAAFFSIHLLRRAREAGRQIEVVILEKKRELRFSEPSQAFSACGGCNYCAGGISPRLFDILKEEDLALPEEVIEARVREITIHGDWKSFELPVPEGRQMLSVFRGSRPKGREGRYLNFDSFLLERAAQEGARVVAAQVSGVDYGADGRPLVRYRSVNGSESREESLQADLAVLAAGVNQSPGGDLEANPLYQSLRVLLPDFRPPKVRRSIICEMQAEDSLTQFMEGEAHFAQYGAADLQIEMSSLLPKGQIVTVVLLGESVDAATPREDLQIVKRFLDQAHIRRFIPPRAHLVPVCLCHPSMTVGMAQNGVGDRVALIGDMAVARLYKDGIFSARLTGSVLADCVLDEGVDRESLQRGYWPVVEEIDRDNAFGRVVFLLNRVIFSRPVLSRMFYQALITEKKTRPKHKRGLADVMWRTLSGDDSYQRILSQMLHPTSVQTILFGGVLTTLRNYLTERLFGLRWTGFGRYATGVAIEDVEKKRQEIFEVLGIRPFEGPHPHFERMYSIRIKADPAAVFHQLGKFGDSDREYFTPRFVTVRRTAGEANVVGSTMRYEVTPRWLSFSVDLEKVVEERYLLYRVRDGFARGGVLAFDVDRRKVGGGYLTIYVAFDFPRGKRPLGRLGWYLFRRMFPSYLHDVIWNHSLCKLKYLVELQEGAQAAEAHPPGPLAARKSLGSL
jgi:flavin-dependent dehydrogenase